MTPPRPLNDADSFAATETAIRTSATIFSINVSGGGIPKTPVPSIKVLSGGLEGDAHDHEKHDSPSQAVSVLDVEVLTDLRAEGFMVFPGATGENLTVAGLHVDSLTIGTRLRFAGGVELELTKVRQPCYVLDAIHPQLKKAIVGRCGFLARVVTTGHLTCGETIGIQTP